MEEGSMMEGNIIEGNIVEGIMVEGEEINEGLSIEPVAYRKGIEPVDDSEGFDASEHFITNQVFEQRSDLIEWARNIAHGHGVVLTTQKSDGLESRPCPRIFIGCDRSGSYRKRQASIDRTGKAVRRTTTKRCGCPFSLKGQKVAGRDEWTVKVICGMHNHRGSVYLEGHAYAGRLKEDQKKFLKEMSRAGIKPREVLRTIKQMDPTNLTTIRAIYNARANLRLQELNGRSPIQHLFECLNNLGYVTFYRTDEATNVLTDLFFAHRTSIDLSLTFPTVYLLDSTYKKNRFNLPLLSIIGITSTEKSFFSAFVFLSSEDESNYSWALECFKSIFNGSSLPSVLVSYRELPLMKAIQNIFPSCKNLLCLWQISNDILANCKKCFVDEETSEKFMRDWNALIRASTEEDYNEILLELNNNFGLYPEVLNYISETWLIPYKEYFVSAWADQHMHLGCISASRTESAHAQLKKYLQASTSNLMTDWACFDSLINQQHADIKTSFSASRIKMSHAYDQQLYSELYGLVSNSALAKINEQKEMAESNPEGIIVDSNKCQHAFRNSLGLPCAHELIHYLVKGLPLPKSIIHEHWTRLSLSVEDSLFRDITPEWEMIKERYARATAPQRSEIKKKLRDIAVPPKEPVVSVKKRRKAICL